MLKIEDFHDYQVRTIIASDTSKRIKLIMRTRISVGASPMCKSDETVDYRIYKDDAFVTLCPDLSTAIKEYNKYL
jgi:hypothetical protein